MWSPDQSIIITAAEQRDVDAAGLFVSLRAERNRLLTACDWTQLPDVTVDQTKWAAYRQALRDLPDNTVDPAKPTWPVPPAA